MSTSQSPQRRVLIVSHHPIFGEGLRRLFKEAQGNTEVVAVVDSLEAAWQIEREQQPDMIVLDYDDQEIVLERCLQYLSSGRRSVRVVLLSLQNNVDAVVFDRWVLSSGDVQERVARLLE